MAEMTRSDLDKLGQRWIEKIEAAEKRESKWLADAEDAEAAYLSDDTEIEGALPDFNILHSNVETIVPAIINSAPVPDIRPRHKSRREDPVANAVANILEQSIKLQIDDGAMFEEVEAVAQDAFMAGRGIVRVRLEADEEDEYVLNEMGEEVPTGNKRVTNERLIYECISWRDYRCGPSKKWRTLPWEAYRHEVTDTDLARLEDDEIRSIYAGVDEEIDKTIWEIWNREDKSVTFVSENGRVLSIQEDPLGLSRFFPTAQPVQPITGTSRLTPTCPYAIYKKLAKELDIATQRINAIMRGLRVKGGVMGDATDWALMAEAGDNELVPISNIEGMAAMGGAEKAIVWWPVDMAISVLQQLYTQREQIKASIYEITGISDIVRGASNSGETATAQEIKTQWGSLRIKKMQRQIESCARDLMVISSELVSMHFSPETLMKITGEQIPPEAMAMLKAPMDHYRIDVETESTVRADLTKSRSEMSAFLKGTGEFFQTMAPVVAQAPQSAAALAKMYAAFAQQFNLGKGAEDALDQFISMAENASKKPKENPAQKMAEAEFMLKTKEAETKMRLEAEKLNIQKGNLVLDGKIKATELQIKQQELALKEATAEVDAAKALNETILEKEQERPVRIG